MTASRVVPVTRQITAEETIPLRLAILRPGLPRETAIFAGDELASTTHWGAFEPGGADGEAHPAEGASTGPSLAREPLAIATLLRMPKPGNQRAAWQVRGMASADRARGKGYGGAVLEAVIAYVASQDPTATLWCNARVEAVPFYRRYGFKTEGAQFDIATVGPHFLMVKKLRPGSA